MKTKSILTFFAFILFFATPSKTMFEKLFKQSKTLMETQNKLSDFFEDELEAKIMQQKTNEKKNRKTKVKNKATVLFQMKQYKNECCILFCSIQ